MDGWKRYFIWGELMTEKNVQIVNIETGEIVKRAMNAKELAQLETDVAANVAAQAEAEAAATAKTALMARLGITADEAKLLLS
jgi:hypothetical protein